MEVKRKKIKKNFIIYPLLLTLIVITLGAYVRLSDAGLGCPDWPGCYGQLTVPSDEGVIKNANEAYPERPLESAKAWKEMLHRYVAGLLLLLVAAITFFAWKDRKQNPLNAKI